MDIPEIYFSNFGKYNGSLGFLINWGVFPRKVTPVESTSLSVAIVHLQHTSKAG